MSKNIFEIWDELGKVTPFEVRRDNWGKSYSTLVQSVICEKMPYGKAYGSSMLNGMKSNHYEYDKRWRETGEIPCAGCYQWTLVEE